MNSTQNELSGDIYIQKNLIMYNYALGLEHYRNSIEILENDTICDIQGKEEGFSQRTLARKYLEKAMMEVGTCEQQLQKIDIYLLLVEMNSDELSKNTRDDYFYGAVEIARTYLGDNYSETSYGKAIIEAYISYIDTSFTDIFPKKYILSLYPLLYVKILSESQKRVRGCLEKVADIANFISTNDSSDIIISKLEEVFGSLRILIIAEGGSGVFLRYRYIQVDKSLGENHPDNMMHIDVNIFDKSRKYSVKIDRGSNESLNQLKESHLKHIINPIICRFIIKKEYEFFTYADDNTGTIELLEKNIVIPLEINDYSVFIADVIQYYDVSGLSRNRGNIESYTRAIDICRGVILSLERRDEISIENLYNYIDAILGGNIDVIVLQSVQSMLLSCNETMNGSGYPFGLSKCNISLEGKIYSIIRAYEAIFSYGLTNQKQALETIQKWAQGGYFDIDILNIFLQSIKGDHTTMKKITTLAGDVSVYRKSEYKKHVDSWFHQLKIVRSIEDGYHEFRKAEGDKSTQNAVIKKINEHSLELRKLALIRKLIIVTRHGSTISDTSDGPPGDDHEVLTPEGIESSHIKGTLFDGLELQIVTSPLVRACETARIICRVVRGCACHIIQTDSTLISSLECPYVTREISIVNPQKDQDIGRYYGIAPKILADNTKNLMNYLMNMVSSSHESVTLFVTHRDSARHMIFWLMNMFDQDRIRGKKTPIDNDSMYEFYFRGDHLIEGEETKTRGLLFSTFNWRSTLHEVNSIIENIFGDTFYTINDRGIDLIILHDIFINFMHRKNEESPEKIGDFIERLNNNSLTIHISAILKGTGIIE